MSSSYCTGQQPHEHLRPFGLTHVLFHKDDPLGLLMAMVTLVPIGLICSYLSVLVTSRKAWVALAAIGQLGNEVINFMLKKYIQDHRPHRCLAGGYGMPSSHSQYILYFATFTTLCLSNGLPKTPSQLVLTILLYSIGVAVCYSRVHLGYHTVAQVLAGSTLGFVVSTMWYLLIQRVLKPSGILASIFRLPLLSLLDASDFATTTTNTNTNDTRRNKKD
ncbi:phosphatidic acid phosphatase type 2/haloperoxidase [Syncephalis plumigaleata]|nr:phosphatidic acid phosphatase type 2/haloperoxidase [Syncephalis plumigaleata]